MRTSKTLFHHRCSIVGTLSRLRISSWIARDIRTVRLGAGTLLALLLMSKSALALDLDGTVWANVARKEVYPLLSPEVHDQVTTIIERQLDQLDRHRVALRFEPRRVVQKGNWVQEQAKKAEDERRKKPTDLSAVVDRSDKPKRDAKGKSEPVVVAATPGIEFSDAGRSSILQEPASIFQEEAPSALAGGQPGGAAAVDGEDTVQNGQALAIRFVSKRDADAAIEGNADIPPTGEKPPGHAVVDLTIDLEAVIAVAADVVVWTAEAGLLLEGDRQRLCHLSRRIHTSRAGYVGRRR